MYGSNGAGSVLGASSTVVGSTVAIVAVGDTSFGIFVKIIAGLSYALLAVVFLSFIMKKRALKKSRITK